MLHCFTVTIIATNEKYVFGLSNEVAEFINNLLDGTYTITYEFNRQDFTENVGCPCCWS